MIFSVQFDTPLGNMTACSADGKLCLLYFGGINHVSDFLKNNSEEVEYNEDSCITQLKKELDEYFSGRRKNFTIPLLPAGTTFQKKVWETLIGIPYGSTRSYAEQAALLGNPGSIRAMAKANGANQIAILIPCHRVIGSDGSLTGYAGGLERKKWLLDHEQRFSGKEYDQSLFPEITNQKNIRK
jgi:AraC family transcriptional regulator of adaptative response/methylated-DNA-[protein]-cysteine methyltransferase